MRPVRVIPCLLINGKGLVKTVKFKAPKYIGDSINAVRIYNEREVDELLILDISATVEKRKPDLPHIKEIVSEAFMPIAYGGGVRSIEDYASLFASGVEKVVIGASAIDSPRLIAEAVKVFGSQSVVVCIDVKKNWLGGYEVATHCGTKLRGISPADFADSMAEAGVGELILNSIDRDGTMQGYDVSLIHQIASTVKIPVVACGGAGKLSDFVEVVAQGGASAVAAGSLFVFHGKHKAVLINYPEHSQLVDLFKDVTPI